ncbi:MAG: AAA family ATPase [Candidatus Diapherotrites archaeon]
MGAMGNIFDKCAFESEIFENRNILLPSYLPEKLPFREKQIEGMVSVLSACAKGDRPTNLFIYGKPGTGKTSCTKYVLNQLEDFANKNCLSIRTIYANCRQYNSKYKVLSNVVQKLLPEKDIIGYSGTFVYENLLSYCEKNQAKLIVAMDEIDKVKDLDELIYALTRANEELKKGSVSMIGISNQITFKERLDARTKSSLCEREIVFPPYNAEELAEILRDRVKIAFKKGVVDESAIKYAAAVAAQESGDARAAVMLLLRAGELAEKEMLKKVTDAEVRKAKCEVEEEIAIDMISTLPEQQQLVIYAIARLTSDKKGIKRFDDEHALCSGEIYDEYKKVASSFNVAPVSIRWFQEYIGELETYGIILTTSSGKGFKGQSRIIRLGLDVNKVKKALEKRFST